MTGDCASRESLTPSWAAPAGQYNRAMPIRASDIILDWISKDGYSPGETSWIHPTTGEHCWQITATGGGHEYIARAPDREQAVVNLGVLIRYSLEK